MQDRPTCDRDPFFEVAVHVGSVTVTIFQTNQEMVVGAGESLTLDVVTGETLIGVAEFDQAELGLFAEQAKMMGFSTTSPTGSPSLSPSLSPSPSFTIG